MSDPTSSFQVFPKDILGDDWYLAMSWDARGMHMHFMFIAWQQIPPCSIPDDDRLLQAWLGYPKEWPRLKEEIFRAWRLQEGRWYNDYLIRQHAKQEEFRDTRKKAAEIRWNKEKPGRASNQAHAAGCTCNACALKMHMHNDASHSRSLFRSQDLLSLSPVPAKQLFAEKFWPAYPRQEARENAEREFCKLDPSPETVEAMLAWLAVAVESDQWQDPTYIPHASNWLTQHRWQSDPPPRGQRAIGEVRRPNARETFQHQARKSIHYSPDGTGGYLWYPKYHHCAAGVHDWECDNRNCFAQEDKTCAEHGKKATARRAVRS